MELLEAWRGGRWRRFRGEEPFRAGGEVVEEFRGKESPKEETRQRQHELLPVDSPEYVKAGRRPPDAAFQVETSATQPVSQRLPSQTRQPVRQRSLGLASSSSSGWTAANGVTNGAAPEKLKELKQVPNPATMDTADLLQIAAKEVELQRQDDRRGWKVHQNPAVAIEMNELGGTRHILKDFQDQLQTLRAQMALLTVQNEGLREKLIEADSELTAAAASKAQMQQELLSHKELLQHAQGNLKQTRNRESRLQRLQDSLQQLVDEKDSKLNNGAINSRASVERTAALRNRIEELEDQLADRQAKGFALANGSAKDDDLENGGHAVNGSIANGNAVKGVSPTLSDASLLAELQQLRAENKALRKKLTMQEEASMRAAEKAAAEAQSLREQLEKQGLELSGAQTKLQASHDELGAAQSKLAAQNAQASQLGSEAAALQARQSKTEKLLREVQERHEASLASQAATSRDLETLSDKYHQVVVQLTVLQDQREKASSDHASAQAQVDSLRPEKDQLESRLAELRSWNDAAVANHSMKAADLERQVDELRHQHESLLRERVELQSQHAAAMARHAEAGIEAERQLVAAQTEREVLRKDQAQLQAEHAAAGVSHATSLEEAGRRLAEAQAELELLRSDHATLQSQHAAAISKHAEATADSQRQLAASRAEHQLLHTQHAELQGLHSSVGASSKTALQESQRQLAETRGELESLRDTHAELQSQHTAAIANHAAELMEAERQLAGGRAEFKALRDEHAGLQREHAAAAASHAESRTSAGQLLAEAREELESLRCTHAKLQSQHDAAVSENEQLAKGLEQQLADAQAQLTASLNSHADLQTEHAAALASRAKEAADLQLRADELLTQARQQDGDLESLQAKHDSAAAALAALQASHTSVTTELDTIRPAHDTANKEIAAAVAEVLALRDQHEAAHEAQVQSSRDLAESQLRKQALQDKVAVLEAIVEGLRADLSAAQSSKQHIVGELEAKQAALQQQVEVVTQQLAAADVSQKQLQQELDAEKAVTACAAAKLKEATAGTSSAQAVVQEHAAKATAAEEVATGLQTALDAATEELAAARQKLATALSSVDEEQAVIRGVLEEAQGRGVLVDQLQRDLDAALAEVEVHEQLHTEHTRAAEEWDKQAAALRSELDAKDRELAEVRRAADSEAEAAAAEASRFKSLLEAAKVETAARATELEEGLRQMEAATSEALTAKQAAASLEMDLASAQDRHSSEAAVAASSLAAALANQDSLQQQLTRLQQASFQKVSTLDTEVANLRSSRDETVAAVAALQADFASHKLREGKARAAVSRELDAAVLAHAATAAKLEAEKAELAQAHADAERRVSVMEAAKSEIEAQLSQGAAIHNTLAARLQERAEAAEQLHSTNHEQAEKIQHLESELGRVQAEISEQSSTNAADAAAQQSAREQLEAALAEVTAVGNRLQDTELQVSREQDSAATAREAAGKLSAALAALQLQHSNLGAAHDTALAAHAEEHAGLSAQLAALHAQHAAALSKHGATVAELARSTAEAAEQRAAGERLRTQLSKRDGELAGALAANVSLGGRHKEALHEGASHQEAAEQLRATLDAAHETHHRTVEDLHAVVKELREAPERDHAALAFELWRLVQENDMLRARVSEYEADVERLVATSHSLGHANPKQKIQYHLRWKQELEELRNECTLLLRERFQLEQCVRYLAVRCGLAVAVDRDVTASRERTPLDKLQPAALVPHYKFAAKAAHVTDAAGDHITLEDLTDDGMERGSPTASERGSASTALSASHKPDIAVEQQILARVAFVCNPPPSKVSQDPLRPSLTPGALLALPASRRKRDAVREWDRGSTRKGPTTAVRSVRMGGQSVLSPEKREALSSQETLTPPESSAGSFTVADTGGPQGEASRSSLGSDPGLARSSAIPHPKNDAAGPTKPSPAAERLASRITQAFSGRSEQ